MNADGHDLRSCLLLQVASERKKNVPTIKLFVILAAQNREYANTKVPDRICSSFQQSYITLNTEPAHKQKAHDHPSHLSRNPRPPRLLHPLPRNIHPHSLIPNPRRPPLMPPQHTRNPPTPTLPPRPRPTHNLLPARIIAAPKCITKPRLALIIALALCAQTRVCQGTRRAQAPATVLVCVAVRCFFAGVAARWGGDGETNWMRGLGLGSEDCEGVVGVAECGDVVWYDLCGEGVDGRFVWV